MTLFRRTTTLALVVAMLAVPTTAFALDDAGDTTETARPAATDDQTDRAADHRLFEEAKARALATIDKQLRALDALSSTVAESRFITSEHAAALRADFARAIGGLEVLANEIEAATTWPELRALVEHLDDWKIAQVLAPKTAQVIASDALVVASRRLATFSGVLENVIGRFESAGFDVEEATRLLAEMNDLIDEGYRLASPVAGNVIGLGAADWPDPAQSILAAGRSDLHDAGAALRDARAHGVDIVQFLRALFDGRLDASVQATDAAA